MRPEIQAHELGLIEKGSRYFFASEPRQCISYFYVVVRKSAAKETASSGFPCPGIVRQAVKPANDGNRVASKVVRIAPDKFQNLGPVALEKGNRVGVVDKPVESAINGIVGYVLQGFLAA
jgi:hypothetical protein